MATTAVPTAEVEPQEVGLDPGRLARLDAYLDGFVERRRQKGSQILVSRRGRIAHLSLRAGATRRPACRPSPTRCGGSTR